ncbi:WD repeat-containing protein 31-like isoform X2 [Dysidea avara]|uniref:WD repeat-containing protein 31-like isoform X2 n=1 Tax=Dysidea avara TaxID=196820 RepID=UPI003331CDF4
MGGRSSKSNKPDHVNYMEDIEQSCYEDKTILHEGPIHSICSVNENLMLSGGADKKVLLYNWSDEAVVGKYKGPEKDITQVISTEPSAVLASSRDHNIYMWHMASTASSIVGDDSVQPLSSYRGHSLAVTAIACCPVHQHLLCSGSRDNSVRVWNMPTRRSVAVMEIPRNLVTGLKWIGTEMSILQSSEDKILRVWDLRTNSLAQQFPTKTNVQTSCDVSHDCNYFLSTSAGSAGVGAEISLWDRRQTKLLDEYRGHRETVTSAIFMPIKNELELYVKHSCLYTISGT